MLLRRSFISACSTRARARVKASTLTHSLPYSSTITTASAECDSGSGSGDGKSGALFDRIAESFNRQGMMTMIGAKLVQVGPGTCEILLPYSNNVTQQQGGFHGGAIGAVADIAAGYASLTVAHEGKEVTTIEYKINFLAACSGGQLRAEGRVVKAGKRVIITAADVYHEVMEGDKMGKRVHCAVMQQTIMAVEKKY
jgi:uncharacterized protein (TIGR00369 family)